MRRLITALSVAAVTAGAIAMPTLAGAQENRQHQYTTGYAAPVAGAVVGTAVGVGLYNGWYGSSSTGITTGVATTTAGAITFGAIAGVGTVALIDATFQPCRGFQALFGANKDACANGEYVGYQPRRMR
jgi:high-affinity Fe2+/Pb2+ permease